MRFSLGGGGPLLKSSLLISLLIMNPKGCCGPRFFVKRRKQKSHCRNCPSPNYHRQQRVSQVFTIVNLRAVHMGCLFAISCYFGVS